MNFHEQVSDIKLQVEIVDWIKIFQTFEVDQNKKIPDGTILFQSDDIQWITRSSVHSQDDMQGSSPLGAVPGNQKDMIWSTT